MKELIYETIVGERKGFVVNISYDRFLHWNCYDSSFIILGKGNLSLSIDVDKLRVKSDKFTDEYCLVDLNDSLSIHESLFSVIGDAKLLIIKTNLIVDQIDLEGIIYTENVYTAEKLLRHFCDRIDFNVEMLVPLNNLRLLNRMIKYHPNIIKFVKHVKLNNMSALSIITHYNTEDKIKLVMNYDVESELQNNKDYEDEIKDFVRNCQLDYSSEIINNSEVENLMELYAEFSENPYEKVAKRHRDDIEADEAYMQLYHQLKRNN
jgi:hypothetical protein